MSIYSGIRSDLRGILQGIAGIPDVAWEGRPYTVTVGTPYIRERLIPVDSEVATLGKDGWTEESFIYLLQIVWPMGGRLSEAEDLADSVRVRFYSGAGVGTPVMNGRITGAERRAVMVEPDWMHVPVRVYGFVYRETVQVVP